MSWHASLSKKFQTRRANKYGAVKVKDSKGTFDSRGEREMHAYLELLARGGVYENVRHHPPAISLTRFVNYKPDWVLTDVRRGLEIAIDFKGVETERFRLICQLWREFGPMPLQIWKKRGSGFYMVKEIEGKK